VLQQRDNRRWEGLACPSPRQPGLDAPENLRHVVGRGTERATIFLSEGDRTDFVSTVTASTIVILVRAGPRPLCQSMQTLLTGVRREFQPAALAVGQPGPEPHICITSGGGSSARCMPVARCLNRPWRWSGVPRDRQGTGMLLAAFGRNRRRAINRYKACVRTGLRS
jgi:hypothetical protein